VKNIPLTYFPNHKSYIIHFLFVHNVGEVCIARGYALNGRGIGVRFPAGVIDFSLIHIVQTGSGAHPPSYPVGTKGPSLYGKAAGP
jgi:hypothetical protein